MVAGVAGGKALPVEVLDEIVAKTDGVPLFVEELTKTVLESGLLREQNGAYVLDRALTPLAIPSTLQDSLMERLDRLAPVKETAQVAAAIGREFSYRLLEAISPIQGAELQDALAQLMAAELIHGRGAPPEATYVFKHALVQDTAYGSLLRSRRQRIHADIARALEERFADQVDAAPAVIARHYTEAGLDEQAARYWLKAAELALSRSAYAEADRYVDAGLALIPRLPQGTDRQSLELALHVARATALSPLKAYTAPETVAAFRAAKRLLDAGVGDDSQRFFVLIGLYMTPYMAARLEPALELAREFVEAAERQDETYYRLVGYRMLAVMQIAMGQNREALKNLQRALQLRDPSRQKPIGFRFSIDPGLSTLCSKIWVLSSLGLHDQAARVRELVRTELPDHKLPGTIALYMQLALAWPELMYGDLEAAERYAAEHVAFCAERKVEQFRLWGGNYQASARAMREPTEENVAALRGAIAANNRSGGYFSDSIFKSYLAEALLMRGEIAGAEAALQDAFAFVERSGERFWLADLYRVDGQIALRRPETRPSARRSLFPQGDRNRPRARSPHARTARRHRPCPAMARGRCAQRSSRAAGADPRRDRGRRDHEGCAQRPRAAGGDRVTGVDVPLGRAPAQSPRRRTGVINRSSNAKPPITNELRRWGRLRSGLRACRRTVEDRDKRGPKLAPISVADVLGVLTVLDHVGARGCYTNTR